MSIQRTASMSTSEITVDFEQLKNGTREQVDEQLHNWMNGKNPSIFIQFIPDEMDEAILREVFGDYGPIDRVEFVPKKNADGKQIGRMVFIHFNHFSKMRLAWSITNAHPEPYEMYWRLSYKQKGYILKCRVNVRPIQRVEYTTSQLTDMFESLNDRIMAQMKDFVQSKDELAEQVQNLISSVAELKRLITTTALPIAPGLQ